MQGGYNASQSGTGGAAITFKLDNVPCVFAVDASFSSHYFRVGATADWWALNDTIVGPLKWFVGGGLYGSFIGGDYFGGALGVRLPIGLNAFFAKDVIEPYVQIAPSFGMEIYDGFRFDWFIPINLGIRFWFS